MMMMTTTGDGSSERLRCPPKLRYFYITGNVAHRRIQPLLLSNQEEGDNDAERWVDAAAVATTDNEVVRPDFLWENAPRNDTKVWRDKVSCYSHLPNGTNILDSKWVLARLLSGSGCCTQSNDKADANPHLAVLESHCFRGVTGFRAFADKVDLWRQNPPRCDDASINAVFRDLTEGDTEGPWLPPSPPPPPNLWVIKDSLANGAGGIWVVGPSNASHFGGDSSSSSELVEGHSYVAQRYVWPPVLYDRRKCHVRVYALWTADFGAHVHRNAFLHVANDIFSTTTTAAAATTGADNVALAADATHRRPYYRDSIHITNCCANSHDPTKFAGEICADLEAFQNVRRQPSPRTENDETVGSRNVVDHDVLTIGLGAFFPSIQASVAALAQKTFPFLKGGEANGGFEYLGLDFILSYRNNNNEPVAYLLEVNAPPSQDTATGLPHAEAVHDSVMRDLMTLWINPCVSGAPAICGGWRCVYRAAEPVVPAAAALSSSSPSDITTTTTTVVTTKTDAILPSKATILNKIRWTLYERKQLAAEANVVVPIRPSVVEEPIGFFSKFARSFFPYYNEGSDEASQPSSPPPIFLENAGGTQVPLQVIQAVSSSLRFRHRVAVGTASQAEAKTTLATILGVSTDTHSIFLGFNASILLFTLAQRYAQTGLLKKGDEIVISSENHLANVRPWLDAARIVGAIIKWWDQSVAKMSEDRTVSSRLEDLLSWKTRIIAVPHASNIVGNMMDVGRLRPLVDAMTNGYCHIVADGVAVVPHRYVALDELKVDWYVISCHKLFGPHLGALCGRAATVDPVMMRQDELFESLSYNRIQVGTVNYEACEGVRGLGRYLAELSTYSSKLLSVGAVSDRSFNDALAEGRCNSTTEVLLDKSRVQEAYRLIGIAEAPLVKVLLEGLNCSSKVRVIKGQTGVDLRRLPVVCFVHQEIPSSKIVALCSDSGVACRNGTFLSTDRLQKEHTIDTKEGVVRFSLAHYNTINEVNFALRVLRSIPGWL